MAGIFRHFQVVIGFGQAKLNYIPLTVIILVIQSVQIMRAPVYTGIM